ncbi:MAG TPA: SUMF1/EgtB/PvdO family nonheme iron enzyme [Polyangiaceae bacterium]|nr:SUMF1/EgtB/PvdO family nonheme iron enzyme [Polyangiaceae bacterium]
MKRATERQSSDDAAQCARLAERVMLRSLLFALLAVGMTAGCSHDWDKLSPAEGGDASPGGAGAGGSGGSGGASGSGGAAGQAGDSGTGGTASCTDPSMIAVPGSTGGFYCVDRTEVTNTAYEGFLAGTPDLTGQPAECAWNTDLTPSGGWPPAVGTGDRPVSFVDFCDATVFCATAGKRLCGAVGGGALGFGSFADAAASEWYNACSENGKRAYPYGQTYDGTACNGTDYGVTGPVKTGSAPKCEGGFSGLLDLSGNVFEWENSCADTAGATDKCRIRGGGYNSNSANLKCDVAADAERSTATVTIGFRCCADAVISN